MEFKILSGPQCPKCGCRDTEKTNARLHGHEIFSCNYCAMKFSPTVEDIPRVERPMVAIYQKTVCPFCNSDSTTVIQGPRGKKRVRQHRCNECKNTFSSRELK